MSEEDGRPRPSENGLLRTLPKDQYDRLLAQCETVSLTAKEVLYEPGAPLAYVFFPKSGVISLLVIMDDGRSVEVGMVGNEGMIGVSAVLGAHHSPTRVVTQLGGESLRVDAEWFREEVGVGGPLTALLHRYVHVILSQRAQLAACSHLHSVQERMCRWLLTVHDRIGVDRFPLTQEFLAQMLVVRRPSVTVSAGDLQRAGLIQYTRGWVTILDRDGLEKASCECYGVIRKAHEHEFAG